MRRVTAYGAVGVGKGVHRTAQGGRLNTRETISHHQDRMRKTAVKQSGGGNSKRWHDTW
jgi:hypothetical protein